MANFDEIAGRFPPPGSLDLGVHAHDPKPVQAPELPDIYFLAAKRRWQYAPVSVRGFARLGDLKNSNFFPVRNYRGNVSYWIVVKGNHIPVTHEDLTKARGKEGLLQLLVEKAYS